MSAGSNYRLSLFKIKTQAVSHRALTLKHCWHCNTLIYEEGVKKGPSIKKANPFYPLRAIKGFILFHDLSHFLDAEKKAGESFLAESHCPCSAHKFQGYLAQIWTIMQFIPDSGLLCVALPGVKLRGDVIMIA